MQRSIVILTQCFPPDVGGIENVMGQLAHALAGRGHRVRVLADGGVAAFDRSAAPLEITRFSAPKLLRRRQKVWHAHRLIRRHGHVDAVFCDSWKSAELFDPRGVPLAILAHGMEYPPGASSSKARRITATLGKAQAVIAASRYASGLVDGYISGPSPRLLVVNPPILPQPEPDATARGRLRQLVGDGGPLLAGLGRLEPRKGFDRTIAALAAVRDRFPGIRYAIAGGGADSDRLREVARQAGVADAVVLLGRVDDAMKAALLAEADLFVMPTRRVGSSVEGFGIVYAEAAWYGTAAIAGRDGGASDAVEDGTTGLLVDGDRGEEIEGALLQLLSERARLEAMGQAAAKRVRAQGTWDVRLDDYLDALGL